MKCHEAIVAWNNHAVTLLENGQFRRGMSLLRTANQVLVQGMEEEHLRHGSNDFHPSSRMVSYDCTSDLRRSFGRSKRCGTAANPYLIQQHGPSHRKEASPASVCSRITAIPPASDSEEEAMLFIYQRLIRINRMPVERGNYILSFIVLFNIALAYQLQVLHSDQCPVNTPGQQRQLRLCRESLNAYRCAFSMKNHGWIRLDTTILLALTNNMCHLSASLGMSAQSDHLRELLTTALVMAAMTEDESNAIIGVDGFWKTALTKTDGRCSAVPSTAVAA